jgi:hypothetical protein
VQAMRKSFDRRVVPEFVLAFVRSCQQRIPCHLGGGGEPVWRREHGPQPNEARLAAVAPQESSDWCVVGVDLPERDATAFDESPPGGGNGPCRGTRRRRGSYGARCGAKSDDERAARKKH